MVWVIIKAPELPSFWYTELGVLLQLPSLKTCRLANSPDSAGSTQALSVRSGFRIWAFWGSGFGVFRCPNC